MTEFLESIIFRQIMVQILLTTDILHIREIQAAITEKEIQFADKTLTFYDVIGRKDKRARWSQYFEEDGVNCVIYMASLAAFDQTMAEDRGTNRFLDSIACFSDLMENPDLRKMQFIILLV